MFCKNCGAEINDNAVVCVKCGVQVKQENIENYLLLAIFSTICCCIPLGIISIVYSCKVNTLLAQGNVIGAKEASKSAKKWAVWALILGFITNALAFFIQFGVALNESGTY